jgi:hypothetical protein
MQEHDEFAPYEELSASGFPCISVVPDHNEIDTQ